MATATFDDWLEVLGMREVLADLLAGRSTLSAAREAADDARNGYHNTSVDFISVLDRLNTVFDEVTQLIEEQGDALSDFRDEISELGHFFRVPDDRLMDDDDRSEIEIIIEQIRGDAEDLADEAADIGDDLEQIAGEIEDLASDAEDGITDAEDEVDAAEAELEDAASDLEE